MFDSVIDGFVAKLNELYVLFSSLSKSSPVVAGAVSLWGLGVLTFLVRNIPSRIWNSIMHQVTTTLVVNNSDRVYYDLLGWVSEKKMHRFVRTLSFSKGQKYDYGDSIIAMGYGRQWFFHDGKLMFMDRTVNQANQSAEVKEGIVLTVFSRSHKAFNSLFQEINRAKEEDLQIRVYTWTKDGWTLLSRQHQRPIGTIALPQAQRDSIIGHIDRFIADKLWYLENGIPWRTGVLLYGPPGTGKTSLVKALCTHYERDLYMIDLSAMTDSDFLNALSGVPKEALVICEDIDAAGVRTRETPPPGSNTPATDGAPKSLSDLFSVSLAGVLNAIDGPASGEGRILIATSNFPEKLDPALTRPGRFDLHMEIGYMTDETFRTYMARFFPKLQGLESWSVKPKTPPCDVQKLVFENRNSPEAILAAVATQTRLHVA